MPSGKSTILAIQSSLFKRIDPNINVNIYDEKMLVASKISEETFKKLVFTTNNPGYTNSYVFLSDIKVYLNNEFEPTTIYGLLPIVQQRIENSDSEAFVNNENAHQPFIDGFQNGMTIGQLIDTLSSLSRNTPDTFGIVKTFSLYIDPDKNVPSKNLIPKEQQQEENIYKSSR
jgi:hypothetical protein